MSAMMRGERSGNGEGAGGMRRGRPGANGSSEDPSRILVVLPNWIGDVVLATPALRALRTRFADAHISFLLKSHLTDVLSGGDWMDEILHWPARKGQSREKRRQGFLRLSASLREERYDLAVLLANSMRSALLARLAGIRRRVGYDRGGRGLLLTDRLLPEKANGKFIPVAMTRYYNAIARYLGCRDCPTQLELFATDEDEAVADRVLGAAGVRPGQPVVVLNPGASYGPAKCWLSERFAEVGERLAAEHDAAVFITCGPKETAIARRVAAMMARPAVSLDDPVLKLGPTKALIGRAALLVTNDTGPRHFARAFGTPVVTIFGSTDPRWTTVDYEFERSCRVEVDCGPCMKRTCPLDHRCMTGVTSEMVLTQARELLGARVASATA